MPTSRRSVTARARTPPPSAFNVHRGYEADLLTGLEAMEDPRLSFSPLGYGPVG